MLFFHLILNLEKLFCPLNYSPANNFYFLNQIHMSQSRIYFMPALIFFRTLKLCDWAGWSLKCEQFYAWVKSKPFLLREYVDRHYILVNPHWFTEYSGLNTINQCGAKFKHQGRSTVYSMHQKKDLLDSSYCSRTYIETNLLKF